MRSPSRTHVLACEAWCNDGVAAGTACSPARRRGPSKQMLRAALIGFPSTGKTTLFQLMTAAREQSRAHGRGEATVGVSKVPDLRLDRLTGMFNPRKRVPATVEFADIGGTATGSAIAL